MENKKRSLVKAIIWRLIILVLLSALLYAIAGDWKKMTLIALVFGIFHTILYYAHERIWARIKWGMIKHPLQDLPVNKDLKTEDRQIIEEKLKELGYID